MFVMDDISMPTYALCKRLIDKQSGSTATSGTVGTITFGTNWTGSGDGPFSQVVSATGYTVTAHTVVDLVANSAVIASMTSDGVTQIYVSNDNATLTAVAIGAKPTQQMTVQAIFSEVN